MKKNIWLGILFFFLIGCSSNSNINATSLAGTLTAYPTNTQYPTYTPSNTQEPKIVVVTATPIPIPTITTTPIKTPMPFNISKCKPISIKTIREAYDKEVRLQLLKYSGLCVKFYYELWQENKWGIGSDYIYTFNVKIVNDELTPINLVEPKEDSFVWGILEVPENEEEPVSLTLRKVEIIPQNQNPIEDEGLYNVGTEMSAGIWKSGNETTFTSECYWARISPGSGKIKANHSGIAGLTVRVYEGEIFQTNSYCAPWYFVSK
jgi:hypothetical protein